MTDLTVEDYSEKAIVVRGETKEHKDALKQLGGKWNSRLRDGAGWIFSKKCEANVMAYIESGKVATPDWGGPKRVVTNVPPTPPPAKSIEITKLYRQMRNFAKSLADAHTKLDRLLAIMGDEVETEIESGGDVDEHGETVNLKPHKRLLK